MSAQAPPLDKTKLHFIQVGQPESRYPTYPVPSASFAGREFRDV